MKPIQIVAVIVVSCAMSVSSWAATFASIGLTWTRASEHSADTTFHVSVGEASGEYNRVVEAGTNTVVTIDRLEPAKTYFFMCRAFANNVYSEPSNEVAYTPPTGDPVGEVAYFVIFRNSDKLQVKWNLNPAGQRVFLYELQYRLEDSPDFTSILLPEAETSFPVDRISRYVVRIRAIGAAGAGPWLERSVPGLLAPSSVFISRVGSVQYRWEP
ncbi:MAG: fibronectin type III domain-containing protein [Hyphomicrobiaceae bacterium]|nr:MAG: fibronectin type III domain-containing protein [Hyphomicrobiaceae bacterium]